MVKHKRRARALQSAKTSQGGTPQEVGSPGRSGIGRQKATESAGGTGVACPPPPPPKMSHNLSKVHCSRAQVTLQGTTQPTNTCTTKRRNANVAAFILVPSLLSPSKTRRHAKLPHCRHMSLMYNNQNTQAWDSNNNCIGYRR